MTDSWKLKLKAKVPCKMPDSALDRRRLAKEPKDQSQEPRIQAQLTSSAETESKYELRAIITYEHRRRLPSCWA